MTIPQSVHEKLTPAQRIRAAVAAAARGDDAELERLKTTAGMMPYKITDPRYADGMERLALLMLAHEADHHLHIPIAHPGGAAHARARSGPRNDAATRSPLRGAAHARARSGPTRIGVEFLRLASDRHSHPRRRGNHSPENRIG